MILKVTRVGPWVLGFLTFLLFIFSARAGCANREYVPYLGKWTGGFHIVPTAGTRINEQTAKKDSLEGYVMVYAMAHSFKMHLEGPQELIDLDGNWTLHGHRLTFSTTGVKIDDQGGALERNPNLPFMPGEALRNAYTHPFVLDLSRDRRRLEGLPMSMGDLIGRHEFARD